MDDIFGSSAGTIREWGETAADAAGLSKKEVSEAAATMGSLLQNVGFDAEGSADEVLKLQQRAADLAATFGGETSQAIDAIGSLMRGEFDTIERYGVKIKQADVNARILSLGLDTSTDSAKRHAESVATLSLFYDQTGDAAGRFGENLDTLAGKLDAGQAKIDNAMASIGEGVANVQLDVIEDTEQLGTMFDEIGNFIDGFAMNLGSQHVEILRLADATGIGFGQMKERIQTSMNETGQSFEQVIADARLSLGPLPAYSQEQALAAVRAVGEAYVAGGPVVAREAGRIAGMLPAEIQARITAIRAAGANQVVEFAAGMIDKQRDPLLAMEALARANEEVLTRAAEITRLLGQLNSAELAAGLADGRPEVRLAAQAAAADIEARLRDLGAWEWGYKTGADFAAGMEAATPLVDGAARGVASATGRQIGIQSEPEAPDSPLHGITKWGGNLVKTYAQGIFGEMGLAGAAGSALASALSPSVGIGGMSGAPMGMVPSPAAVSGGNQIHVHMEDRITARSVDDVGYGLKRLGRHGKLPGFSDE